MAFIRAFGGGGIPSALKSAMNAVLNKKFGTSTTYAPEDWPEDVNLLGPLPEKTVSGSIAHIEDGADTVPIKTWDVTVDANLDGVSSVKVTQAGKNLLPFVNYDGGAYNPAVGTTLNLVESATQFTKNGNAYSIDTTTSWTTFTVLAELKNGVGYHIKYTFSASGANLGRSNIFLDADFKVLATYNETANPNTTNENLTIPTGAKYYCIVFTNRSTSVNTLTITEPQLEVGNSASAYADYTAPTVTTVSLGRTIYGGTADVVNGTGTDYGVKETVSSSYLSGLSSSYIGYSSSVSAMNNHPCVWVRNFGYPTANEFVVGGIKCACNHFPVTMNNSQIISTQYRIYFDVDGKNISSVQDFIDYVSALENNNDSLEVIYQKSSPDDFTFSPITPTPETALGVNNFWADEGDSEVTYRADISLALAANSSRGLMMASRPVTQLIGEESDLNQVNELVEDDEKDETEQEGDDDENIRQDAADR